MCNDSLTLLRVFLPLIFVHLKILKATSFSSERMCLFSPYTYCYSAVNDLTVQIYLISGFLTLFSLASWSYRELPVSLINCPHFILLRDITTQNPFWHDVTLNRNRLVLLNIIMERNLCILTDKSITCSFFSTDKDILYNWLRVAFIFFLRPPPPPITSGPKLLTIWKSN